MNKLKHTVCCLAASASEGHLFLLQRNLPASEKWMEDGQKWTLTSTT